MQRHHRLLFPIAGVLLALGAVGTAASAATLLTYTLASGSVAASGVASNVAASSLTSGNTVLIGASSTYQNLFYLLQQTSGGTTYALPTSQASALSSGDAESFTLTFSSATTLSNLAFDIGGNVGAGATSFDANVFAVIAIGGTSYTEAATITQGGVGGSVYSVTAANSNYSSLAGTGVIDLSSLPAGLTGPITVSLYAYETNLAGTLASGTNNAIRLSEISVSAVPEPSSTAFLVVSGAGLAALYCLRAARFPAGLVR